MSDGSTALIQYFVYYSTALFLSFFSQNGTSTFAWICSFHFLYQGFIDDGAYASGDEFWVFKPLTIAFGTAIGIFLGRVIRKPRQQVTSCWRIGYSAKCVAAAIVWLGLEAVWQWAAPPGRWWVYIFVVTCGQILVMLFSQLLIDHDEAWNSPHGDSLRVHIYFFIFNSCFANIPYAVTLSADPHGKILPQVYCGLIAFGMSGLVLIVLNSILRDEPPRMVPK